MSFDSGLAYKIPESFLGDIVRYWRPKVFFEIDQGRYLIKVAESRSEFESTIRLRSLVFLKEFAGAYDDGAMDVSMIDKDADFLIIKDKESEEVVASYRLICSEFSNDFYSCSEFRLQNFLNSPGRKLELSRACIRADKRNSGNFLHMLWKGLVKYIKKIGATHLFGCSSLQHLRLPELVDVYQSLRDNDALSQEYDVEPLSAYRIFDMSGILRLDGRPRLATSIPLPPLLLGYIKAGAKVHGAPAYDQEFNCLDLLTILDFRKVPFPFLQRYLDADR